MSCVRTLCACHGFYKCAVFVQSAVLRSCRVSGQIKPLFKSPVYRQTQSLCFSSAQRSCWTCGASASAQLFFCSACKVIQPPNEDATYFQILSCDQTFALDIQKLQRRYLELQRSLHPDNFSLKSPTEREYSEKQSALVNKAFRTLQKPLTRAVYMLQLSGVELEEGTDASVEPSFLLEVMETNEKLAESQSQEEVDAIGRAMQEMLKGLTEQMNTSLNKGDLRTAKALLARMKYFSNLEEKVKEKQRENL